MWEATFILLGWLLGIISEPIVDGIRQGRKKPQIAKTLALELEELRLKLLMNALDVSFSKGTLSQKKVDWARPILKSYTGLHGTVVESYITKVCDAPEATRTYAMAMSHNPKMAKRMPKHQTPYLDTHTEFLSWFDQTTQRLILELRARLGMYRTWADYIEHYHGLTFDSSQIEENHSRILENIEINTERAESEAYRIVNFINQVLPRLDRVFEKWPDFDPLDRVSDIDDAAPNDSR